jgi:hypothetical protein
VKNSLIRLVIFFFLINVFAGLAFGVLYLIDDKNQLTVVEWIEYSTLSLLNLPPDIRLDLSFWQRILRLLQAFLSVVLPSLFLGTIVFKLLVRPKIIVFQKKCSIFFNRKLNKHVISIRFYPSTPLQLVDVRVKTIFSRLRPDKLGLNIPIKSHTVIRESSWPIASQHIPFTTYVHLEQTDVDSVGRKLNSLQKKKFYQGGAELTVIIAGTIPQLGTEFVETYRYYLPDDIQWGKPQPIATYGDFPEGTRSEEWAGWSNFEGISQDYSDTLPN